MLDYLVYMRRVENNTYTDFVSAILPLKFFIFSIACDEPDFIGRCSDCEYSFKRYQPSNYSIDPNTTLACRQIFKNW